MEMDMSGWAITLRPMLVADIARVREIDVLSFSMPWSERSYHFEVTENDHSSTWVAEITSPDGKHVVVGMLVAWVILDEAHIATIAVHPNFRGRKIGQGLLARALQSAHERGARLAFLEVRRGNLVAQEMYTKFGFQVVGERPHYYQDNNEDALLMTLTEIRPEALRPFLID